MKTVLITGGSGLVGTRLTHLLQEKGFKVRWLSRTAGQSGGVQRFKWDINKAEIDLQAFEGVDILIHLAGAGVAEHRWTAAYKQEIIDSRVKSAQLLGKALKTHPIKRIISASGVGIYGDRGSEILTEDSQFGNCFLANVSIEWEKAAMELQSTGADVAIVRIGIVLSTLGGALPVMAKPVKFGIGAYLGNGKQFTPWIHLDDLCGIFIHLINQPQLKGAFNASAPTPLSNKDFIKAIAKAIGRPFLPSPGPAFFLKLVLGEQADMVLMSNRTSSDKIVKTGFKFRFTNVITALQDIYQRKI